MNYARRVKLIQSGVVGNFRYFHCKSARNYLPVFHSSCACLIDEALVAALSSLKGRLSA